jgi:ankyrin repeat protein
LENGATVDVAMTDGATPLCIAAQNGHAALAALLLENGAKVDLAMTNGATPLYFAARQGHTDLAVLLLANRASVDLAASDGATPLFIAAQNGHTALGALLLQNGASINRAIIGGATPLLIAAQNGHTDIVSALILQNKSDLAAQGFFTRSLQNFATSYVDKADHKGITPLVAAIEKGHLAVVSVLVAAGASLDIPDAQNNTPLLLAVSKNDPQIVALLLQAGANSGIKNKAGQSALDLALASSKPNSLLIDLVLEDASTRKQRSFFASADAQLAPQLDTAQLAEQACALLMKLQHADATVQATGWRTFVNALCTKLGLRHIVAEGLVAMLRQMPADWPSVGGGTSKPTAAQVRQFYLHMLGSAQRLHALNNQDDPHRTAYYQAQQDMPAVAKLINVAASQSGQLIGAGQTALGDWAGSLQRFFAELSVANSAADIETQLQNEMGLHPLLTTTIAPLWASLKTKSVAGLILAMRKKFNTPEFASTVLEAGDSDVLRFMLIEQLQVLNNLKAPRRNKE